MGNVHSPRNNEASGICLAHMVYRSDLFPKSRRECSGLLSHGNVPGGEERVLVSDPGNPERGSSTAGRRRYFKRLATTQAESFGRELRDLEYVEYKF